MKQTVFDVSSTPTAASWLLAAFAAVFVPDDPSPAQEVPQASVPPLVVCDSTDDRVMLLRDVDGSGTADLETFGEVIVFYDDESPGPDLSVPAHIAPGVDGALYLLDGGTVDAIIRLLDLNGDGDANDAGEFAVFYDSTAEGPGLSTANTLIGRADGSFLLSDDGSSAKRLLLLRDANGDGDALDSGEATVVYDATTLSEPIGGDIESVAEGSGGELYFGEKTLQAVFVLVDRTGDGDYLDEDESRIYFQASDDFALGDPDAIVVADGKVYVVDEDTGTILCLEDLNDDGDALDPGEARVFLDSSSSPRVADINDFLALPEAGFLVIDGASDSVYIVEDTNGDGDALDEGEVREWLVDDSSTFATPSGLALLPDDRSPPVERVFVRAEVNGDGRLNITDAVVTLTHLFVGPEAIDCLDSLDADDSGAVNISDAVYSLNFQFLGGPSPPPPFPNAGPDPTADSIDC